MSLPPDQPRAPQTGRRSGKLEQGHYIFDREDGKSREVIWIPLMDEGVAVYRQSPARETPREVVSHAILAGKPKCRITGSFDVPRKDAEEWGAHPDAMIREWGKRAEKIPGNEENMEALQRLYRQLEGKPRAEIGALILGLAGRINPRGEQKGAITDLSSLMGRLVGSVGRRENRTEKEAGDPALDQKGAGKLVRKWGIGKRSPERGEEGELVQMAKPAGEEIEKRIRLAWQDLPEGDLKLGVWALDRAMALASNESGGTATLRDVCEWLVDKNLKERLEKGLKSVAAEGAAGKIPEKRIDEAAQQYQEMLDNWVANTQKGLLQERLKTLMSSSLLPDEPEEKKALWKGKGKK